MKQNDRPGHVDAIFGGKPVRFDLARDLPSLLKLEEEIGSLRGLLGRFEAGTWMMSDVRTILARAHPAERGMFLGLARPRVYDPRTGERMHTPTAPQVGIEPTRLDPILGSAPPITYALLAARVLEAMLYGLEPSHMVWDEREPAGAPAAPAEAAA